MQIPIDAFERQTIIAQRMQCSAARNEDDVMTGLLQPRTEHAAHCTGADDGHAQPIKGARGRVGIAHGLPIEKPEICASVLCPIRKPTAPSVLLSFPAATNSALL